MPLLKGRIPGTFVFFNFMNIATQMTKLYIKPASLNDCFAHYFYRYWGVKELPTHTDM